MKELKQELEWLRVLNQKYYPDLSFIKVSIKSFGDPLICKAFSTKQGRVIALKLTSAENFSLTHFPIEVCHFKHLESLSLCGHEFSQIPECISSLTHLKYLNLSSNRIKTIPESFSKLERLKILALDDNPIEGIPECLRHLPLKLLYINAMPQYWGVNVLDHVKLSEIEGEITEEKIRKRMASILPYIR